MLRKNMIIKLFLAMILLMPSMVLASEVVLKSGQKLEGTISEQTVKYIKIDTGTGTALTYYEDEIDTIDGKKLQVPAAVTPAAVQAAPPSGQAYTGLGNFSPGIVVYTKAIEDAPNSGILYYRRGIAYYYDKQYGKAWEDVHKAEELGATVNPDFIKTLKQASGRDQ